MKKTAPNWRNPALDDLVQAISSLKSPEETARFLRDLCTPNELTSMAQRWQVALELERGLSQREISEKLGASTATVSRVAHWVRRGEGGYRLALDRRFAARKRRLRQA